MNYTENYHLPQWVETDRVMMDDFNAAMASIESGLDKTGREAANYASPAQANASALATKAQTAADAAMAAARAAQETADGAYSPGQKPYTAGEYTGNGTTITIELGYRPSFVIVTGQVTVNETNFVCGVAIAAPGIMGSVVTFLSKGFSVENPSTTSRVYPQLNVSGQKYGYIAFR